MTAPFDVWLSIAIWGGTLISFPFLVFAVLRFVFPALTKREKFTILSGLGASTALFVAGSVLAYRETLPLVVAVFRQIGDWMHIDQSMITIDTYIPVVLKLIAAFGLVFQIPLILFVLGLFGFVTSKGLRDRRRIAIIISFVLSMVLTPPDPMSQMRTAVYKLSGDDTLVLVSATALLSDTDLSSAAAEVSAIEDGTGRLSSASYFYARVTQGSSTYVAFMPSMQTESTKQQLVLSLPGHVTHPSAGSARPGGTARRRTRHASCLDPSRR
jgi:Tat protein translocase TatC